MSEPAASVSAVLRCQQTLQRLAFTGDGFYSDGADLFYPYANGLVFMGYDERDAAFFDRVVAEERDHQTSAEHMDRDLAFLRQSAGALVDVINALIHRQLIRPSMTGLEIGAASGWPSWLLAEVGCTMWLAEIEPNSLASGLAFAHENIGSGQRIVCDATLLPFADETFDLVLCKEFAHHVSDKLKLLNEVSRVLKKDGLLVLLEPVRSIQLWATELWHPDSHFGHSIVWPTGYVRPSRAAGLEVIARANHHSRQHGRFPLFRRLRKRSRTRLRAGKLSLDPLSTVFMWSTGGSLLILARRVGTPAPRPEATIIPTSPERETWSNDGYDRTPFVEELRRIATRLQRL